MKARDYLIGLITTQIQRTRLLLSCVFLLFLVGSGCSRPYSSPQVSVVLPPNGSTRFDGLIDLATPDAKIMWTHGVCRTGYAWVRSRTALIMASLGPSASVTDGPTRSYSVDNVPNRLIAYNKIFRQEADGKSRVLSVYFLVWSSMMDRSRLALRYDWENEYKHASLNRTLKRFFDECLVDAVVYLGAKGPKIRSAMQQAIKDAVADPVGGRVTDGLGFVSESLGSKIMADSIVAAAQDLVKHVAKARAFFMIANQIPLEDQADDDDTGPAEGRSGVGGTQLPDRNSSALARMLVKIRAARSEQLTSRRPDDKITVVAFSDPNDVLSQDLKSEFVRDPNAHVLNVTVSNAPTYAGWLEMPDAAHCGYGGNQQVINMVVTGSADRGETVPGDVLAFSCIPADRE
ncbi:MAG: hypothetical protein U1E70_28485 [Acetobacteraceae bacterium]